MRLTYNHFRLLSILGPILGLAVVFSVLQGCSSGGEKRPEYMDAYSVEALQIPPKLTEPDTSGAMKLPQPAAKTDCN